MDDTIKSDMSHGKRRYACGPKCWNGKGTRCTCECGGKNHGQGWTVALENLMRDQGYEPQACDMVKRSLKRLETSPDSEPKAKE